MNVLKIGALAERTGVNAPAIRYYEAIGLMPRPRRSGAQRFYGDEDVKRLTFIRRDFGFSIEQVKSLVALTQDRARPCTDARDLAAAHLAAVREKLIELKTLERSIADFVAHCDAACAGGPGPECVILTDMSKHPPRGPARSAISARAGRTGSKRRRQGK